MTPQNILPFIHRGDFRRWLAEHHGSGRECRLHLKRGKAPAPDCMPYPDAVEETLCFGWIDSTLKTVDGRPLQRFGPRAA